MPEVAGGARGCRWYPRGVQRPWVGTPRSAFHCHCVAPGGLTAPGKGMNGGGKAVVEREQTDAPAHLTRPVGCCAWDAMPRADQVGQDICMTLYCKGGRHPTPVSTTGKGHREPAVWRRHLCVQGGSWGASVSSPTALCVFCPILTPTPSLSLGFLLPQLLCTCLFF